MGDLVTSDRVYLARYKRKGKLKEKGREWCYFHNPPVEKRQVGRMLLCPKCKGAQIRLPTGKPVKRQLKEGYK